MVSTLNRVETNYDCHVQQRPISRERTAKWASNHSQPPRETLGNGRRRHGKCQREVFLVFSFARGSESAIAKNMNFIWWASSCSEFAVSPHPNPSSSCVWPSLARHDLIVIQDPRRKLHDRYLSCDHWENTPRSSLPRRPS